MLVAEEHFSGTDFFSIQFNSKKNQKITLLVGADKRETMGRTNEGLIGFIYSKMYVQQSMVLSEDLPLPVTCKVRRMSCVMWVDSNRGGEHLCRWPAKSRRTACYRNQGLRRDERARNRSKGDRGGDKGIEA